MAKKTKIRKSSPKPKKAKLIRRGTGYFTESQLKALEKRNRKRWNEFRKVLDKKLLENKRLEIKGMQENKRKILAKIERLGKKIDKHGDYSLTQYKEKARELKHDLFKTEQDIKESNKELLLLKKEIKKGGYDFAVDTEIVETANKNIKEKENKPKKPRQKKQKSKKKEPLDFEKIIVNKIMNIIEKFDEYVYTKWEQHKAELIKERLIALLAGAGRSLDEIAEMIPELEREIEQFIVDSEETYEDSLNENNSNMTTRSWNRIMIILGISERDFEEYVTFSD